MEIYLIMIHKSQSGLQRNMQNPILSALPSVSSCFALACELMDLDLWSMARTWRHLKGNQKFGQKENGNKSAKKKYKNKIDKAKLLIYAICAKNTNPFDDTASGGKIEFGQQFQ